MDVLCLLSTKRRLGTAYYFDERNVWFEQYRSGVPVSRHFVWRSGQADYLREGDLRYGMVIREPSVAAMVSQSRLLLAGEE